MFQVQRVQRAFTSLKDIPEGLWLIVSQHRTLSAARRCKEIEHRAMRQRCGPGAWDSHRRIVLTERSHPVVLVTRFECYGNDGEFAPGHVDHVRVIQEWEPSTPEPLEPDLPTGWGPNLCPACRTEGEICEAREIEEWVALDEQYEKEAQGMLNKQCAKAT